MDRMRLNFGFGILIVSVLVLSLFFASFFYLSTDRSITGLFLGTEASESPDPQASEDREELNESFATEDNGALEETSYRDVKEFAMEDSTHENELTSDYVCGDFANDVVGNALTKGIPACTVFLDHTKGSHSIVAFNTTDKGVVFLEPQTDEFVVGLEEDEDYCDLAGWNCSWKVEEIKHCFE